MREQVCNLLPCEEKSIVKSDPEISFHEGLKDLLGFRSMHDLADAYRGWVEGYLREMSHFRDGKWTESVAVGSEAFVTATKEKLGLKAKGRQVVKGWEL